MLGKAVYCVIAASEEGSPSVVRSKPRLMGGVKFGKAVEAVARGDDHGRGGSEGGVDLGGIHLAVDHALVGRTGLVGEPAIAGLLAAVVQVGRRGLPPAGDFVIGFEGHLVGAVEGAHGGIEIRRAVIRSRDVGIRVVGRHLEPDAAQPVRGDHVARERAGGCRRRAWSCGSYMSCRAPLPARESVLEKSPVRSRGVGTARRVPLASYWR